MIIMMTKKITKKDYFKMIASVISESAVENKEELMMFVDKEIGLLEKKRESKKVNAEAEAFMQRVEDVLAIAEKPVTATEIIAMSEEFKAEGIQNQKVTAALTKLVKAGRVVNVKDGKKSVYSLAD